MQRVDTNEPAVELEPFDAAASMIVDGKTVNSYPYYMRTPEEYASDYPEDPARVLAAQLVDLGNQLNFELIDVPEADEERNLRIEHYLEVIRAWKTKEMANGG